MQNHLIFGVHITNRLQKVSHVQELFSEYGCNIKTRLGLHEADNQICSPNGLILLEMVGDENLCQQMADKLNAIDGVEVQKMYFDHP